MDGDHAGELFDLTGKRALVTGSSQGIGFALAEGLAAAGAEVVLNGRDAEKLTRAAADLRAAAPRSSNCRSTRSITLPSAPPIDGFRGDGGPDRHAGQQCRHAASRAAGGFPGRGLRAAAAHQCFARVFNVGQAVARHMIGRGAGKIINIASVQSALARPGIAPYTASKGAVANLTKGMATDWAKYGLQVNAIAPGYFDTPLNAALVADRGIHRLAGKAHAGRPLGRSCRSWSAPACSSPRTRRAS